MSGRCEPAHMPTLIDPTLVYTQCGACGWHHPGNARCLLPARELCGSCDAGLPMTCTCQAQPPLVSVLVRGTPAPQGSKRHVGGGRMIESSAKVRPWRQDVRAAAEDVIGPLRPLWTPLDGPLRVSMVFTLRKPLSAPKRTRSYPIRTPDLSKLVRSTEDALTDAGVWVDDARVVEYVRLAKVYPGEDADSLDVPGARIAVYRLGV
jgi:Holliday junction resolvase RusA-like endonuclease